MNQHVRFARPTPRASAPAVYCADMVGLVVFHEGVELLSPLVSAFNPDFLKAVDRLPRCIKSRTNLTAGLRCSIDLLRGAHPGLRRRLWALTDGQDNVEEDGLFGEVKRAAENRININTIGFGLGPKISPERLKAVSAGTRTGRYMSVDAAQTLGEVMKRTAPSHHRHRGEATVFCIDVSPSMEFDYMDGKRKIDVVRDTMYDLIRYKQKMWS